MAKNKKNEEDSGGVSLDDAFSDDEDVVYAEPKKKKIEPKIEKKVVTEPTEKVVSKASKPIGKIKKGDKIKVDNLTLDVDAHYVLMDHGSTKEMAIECFDAKTDKDYQIRYFSDQVENSLEVYVLEEIVYSRLNVKKIEW